MVIAEISNGLGNQLFQYAAARALAIRTGTKLKLATSYFEKWKDREFELLKFAINAELLEQDEKVRLYQWKQGWRRRLSRLCSRAGFRLGPAFVGDANVTEHSSWQRLSGQVVLDGFWQSETYFLEHEESIRKDLTLTTEPTEENHELITQIRSKKSVALHVRRGDYATTHLYTHGTCEAGYYTAAVDHIYQINSDLHLYVFSDDPSWAQANLIFKFPTTFVTQNCHSSATEDLRLMMNCRHFVISNSTYSWWGAWLAQVPSKIVVAPKTWKVDGLAGAAQIIPPSWITM